MAFKFLRDPGGERLERIEEKIQLMLQHDTREFETAMRALLGEVEPSSVNDEVRSTDQRVNELEREIRRDLVVHASVFGGIDTPAVLIYMSIVKDIERIGDYSKNLIDLALDGANFATTPDAEEWRRLTAEIVELLREAATAFASRHPTASRALIARGDRMLDLFDERVSGLVRDPGDPGDQAVARALAHRYLKRVVAHVMNFLSAVVMPVDRIDFFGQDPED